MATTTLVPEKSLVVNRNRFAAFLRRYRHLFILASALTVFSTYLVKEMLRDRLRDLVSALELAKSVYAIRADNAGALGQLAALQSRIRDFRQAQPVNDDDQVADEQRAQVYDTLTAVRMELFQINLSLDNIRKLNESLSDRGKEQEHLKDLQTQSDGLFTTSGQYWELAGGVKGAELSGLVDKAYNLDCRTGLMCVACADLADKTIRKAEAIRDQRQRSYEVYTKWSFGLYGLAWGLGLLTALSGIETPERAED